MAGNKQGIPVTDYWMEYLLRDGFDTEGTLRAKLISAVDGVVDNGDGTHTFNYTDGTSYDFVINDISGIALSGDDLVITFADGTTNTITDFRRYITSAEANDDGTVVFTFNDGTTVTSTGSLRGAKGEGNTWTADSEAPETDTDIASFNGDMWLVTGGADVGNVYVASNVTDSTTTWTQNGNIRGGSGPGGFDIAATDGDGNDLDITTANTSANPVSTTAYVDAEVSGITEGFNINSFDANGDRLAIDADNTVANPLATVAYADAELATKVDKPSGTAETNFGGHYVAVNNDGATLDHEANKVHLNQAGDGVIINANLDVTGDIGS